MKARVSNVVAGLAAMVASYSCLTVTIAEEMDSTSKIASVSAIASSSSYFTQIDFVGCHEIYCSDLGVLNCDGTNSGDTDFSQFTDFTEITELTEVNECFQDINDNLNLTSSLCNTYSEITCCLALIDHRESLYVPVMNYYACIMDSAGCSSEYYSCVERYVGEGSASSDATVTTGNGQLSYHFVCAAVGFFTVAFAMM